jgi:hypothetical protein
MTMSELVTPGIFRIGEPRPCFLTISSAELGKLISINMEDGSIIYGEHYTPDGTAKLFWEAVSSEYREAKNEIKRLLLFIHEAGIIQGNSIEEIKKLREEVIRLLESRGMLLEENIRLTSAIECLEELRVKFEKENDDE